MIQPGDVVTTDFAGAKGIKRRPCIVVSTSLYHRNHRDVIVAVVTSQIASATTPTDHILKDWGDAGLAVPSVVRLYLGTCLASNVRAIGQLSKRDWEEVKARLKLALAVDSGD